jgi:membrane protease YdiL (CAAX protease family)
MRRLGPEVGIFALGSACLIAVVRLGVPLLSRSVEIDPFAAWMLLSIPFVFAPPIALSVALLKSEANPVGNRLRFSAPPPRAWAWAALAAVVIAAGSATFAALATRLGLSVDPFGREPRPWPVWMFAVWAVYWPINIFGEELAWRAVLLPRMELTLGANAWLLNAALWGVFHLGFGPGNLLTLIPTLLLVPWAAQKTRSTWVGVALHGFVSLPGMVLIATGKV